MAKNKKPTGSYCGFDEVSPLDENQAYGFNCTYYVKGKKGIHTRRHISLQKRGR